MKNAGCDLHTRHQQVAMLDQKTDTQRCGAPDQEPRSRFLLTECLAPDNLELYYIIQKIILIFDNLRHTIRAISNAEPAKAADLSFPKRE